MTRDHDRSHRPARSAVETAWDTERGLLLGIATGIVGDAATAEDVVQEAFDRLGRQDADRIDNVGAWLTVVVRRLAINQVLSAPVRREKPTDPHGPERPGAGTGVDPADRITLDDEVQMALSVVLGALSPAERTSFVLHDIFGLTFDEVAEIVGRTAQACRQLASRGRRSLRSTDPEAVIDTDPVAATAVTERFIAACTSGDLDELVAALDPDVSGWGQFLGGDPTGRPHHGADVVAGRMMMFLGPQTGRRLVPVDVVGSPGVLAIGGGLPLVVLRLTESGDRITEVHAYISQRMGETDARE